MTVYTITDAQRLLAVVDAGLVSGLGLPFPGQMCVEAAVCYALGEPHGDSPSCVALPVRAFKVVLNDSEWSSVKARAAGLRALAVAQLGSLTVVDEWRFTTLVAETTIREILPNIFRRIGLSEVAERCEREGSADAAYAAADAANAAAYAAYAAANAAAYAAYAAANAAAYAAAHAAHAAARAAHAAAAAAAYAAIAIGGNGDAILTLSAALCFRALRECGSPGVALWDAIQAQDGVIPTEQV